MLHIGYIFKSSADFICISGQDMDNGIYFNAFNNQIFQIYKPLKAKFQEPLIIIHFS